MSGRLSAGLVLGLLFADPRWAVASDKPSTAQAASPRKLSVGEELFARRIRPLFKEKCLACHGDKPEELKGQFDLRSRTALLKGGESGEPAIAPGKPDASPLYQAVTRKNTDLAMPPKENDKLTDEQVGWIRTWIEAGAPWTESITANDWADETADGVMVKTSGGRSPEWTNRRYLPVDLWAYQPIRNPSIPPSPAVESHHPVDAFIRERLIAKGIARSADEADRRTLIRRVTFDLTGLPPTVDEIDAFLRDESPEAYQRLVRRLLDSPRYGEQQARHWLDVVRYADTSGLSNDYERPHAWRYRDYVIRSLNADKPYDRFVVEQVAGDELLENEADSDSSDCLIATGFLRMGPWEHTGMTVAAITRQDFLDDVTHHIGVTLLGQGLRCARCHDHKFDPVPTQDYYRIQAVFASTQFVERPVAFQPHENTSDFDVHREVSQRRLRDAQQVLGELKRKVDAATAEFLRQRGVQKLADLSEAERPGLAFGLSKQELSIRKIYQKRVDYFERELKRFEPYAFAVYSGPSNAYTSPKPLYNVPVQRDGLIPVVQILPGGSLETPSVEVTPGVLSAANAFMAEARRATNDIPDKMLGRRLTLARWIVSRANPLTARVIVNRIWQQHFGRGLVATPNNFGKMGARPTHPQLLDWLATWFMDHDWSLKQLHELVVTSETYRQRGEHPDAKKLLEMDAKNELLAYFPSRRLAAEEMRDAMLAASGELNSELGGPGVFPEINREVATQPRHIMGSVAPAYQPSSEPQQRNRRTIYTFKYRTLPDPFLEVFNRPGSEISCECRDQTTVTPQVFALFNGEFSQSRALAFAQRIEQQTEDARERIDFAFRCLYGRPTTEEEVTDCLDHLTEMTAHHRRHEPRRIERPTTIRRQMIEEMTGEEVQWDELLETKGYVGGLQPADVSPETRAWADVCLVLMNSNEFLYVR